MKDYLVEIDDMNAFYSRSRDAKKHLANHGGNKCTVYDRDNMHTYNKKVSEARNSPEFGIHSVTI